MEGPSKNLEEKACREVVKQEKDSCSRRDKM